MIVMPRREDKRRDMRWWFDHADQIAAETKAKAAANPSPAAVKAAKLAKEKAA